MKNKETTQVPEIFNFEKNEVENKIIYDLNLLRRLETSFDFVYDKLVTAKHYRDVTYAKTINLDSIKRNEGKNYDWLAVKSGSVKLIIRKYKTHFTIYVKLSEKRKLNSGRIYINDKYGAFIFHVNEDKMTDEMKDNIIYYEKPFTELNKVFINMIALIKDRHMQLLWNPVGFIRPKYVDVKIIYYNESIYSIDKLMFCAEELSNIHVSLFAENEMLEKLKNSNHLIGQKFDYSSKVTEIITEFPKEYLEPYYHGVGIMTIDDNKYERIHDVYSLTMYHLDFVFKS